MKDSRRSCRVPYDSPITVSWKAQGESNNVEARCIDISLGGVSVVVPVEIPVSTVVTLRINHIDFSGSASVSHVTQRGSEFVIGLEFSQETKEAVLNPSNELESV